MWQFYLKWFPSHIFIYQKQHNASLILMFSFFGSGDRQSSRNCFSASARVVLVKSACWLFSTFVPILDKYKQHVLKCISVKSFPTAQGYESVSTHWTRFWNLMNQMCLLESKCAWAHVPKCLQLLKVCIPPLTPMEPGSYGLRNVCL